jgi:hypothetical protein
MLFLSAKQWLVVAKKHLIDLEYVIFSLFDEIFDYHVKLLAAGESVSGALKQVVGFANCQFQRYRKRNRRPLARNVALARPDFRKQFAA